MVRRVAVPLAAHAPRRAAARCAARERGDRFRMLAFTPAGTGGATRRALVAAGARWRFDRRDPVRRIPGYHSGPVEQLDALEARLTAPRSGRFAVHDRKLSRLPDVLGSNTLALPRRHPGR